MKKTLLLSAPLFLLLFGCGTSHVANNTTTKTVSNPPSNTPNHTSSSMQNTVSNDTTKTPTFQQTSWTDGFYVTEQKYTTSSQSDVYPVIHRLPNTGVENQINAFLKKDSILTPSGQKVGPYNFTSEFSIVYQKGDIINFIISSYYMPKGAAHGMPSEQSIILNVKTGDTYTLKDLFQPGSDYLTEVSNIVRNEDTKHVLDTFGKFTGVTATDEMYLTSQGFVVYFAPYEWASFAQGFLYYPVSYDRVSNIPNNQSAFFKALNDSSGFQDITSIEDEDIAKIESLGYTVMSTNENEVYGFASTPIGNGQTLMAWDATSKSNPDADKVFFFLDGKYLGTDTLKAHGYIYQLNPDGRETISVGYANYTTTGNDNFGIHYHWDGSKLEMIGSFPTNYNQWIQ